MSGSFFRFGLIGLALATSGPGLLSAEVPLAATSTSAEGNPFKAPAMTVRSFFDYQSVSGVSDRMQEFFALNSELAGSVAPSKLTFEEAKRSLAALYKGDAAAFLSALERAPQ